MLEITKEMVLTWYELALKDYSTHRRTDHIEYIKIKKQYDDIKSGGKIANTKRYKGKK